MKGSIKLDSLGIISDDRLIRQAESLRGREVRILVFLLRHLIEIERRRLYLPRGYSSLFEFCTAHLKYSRSAAGRRIAAARALARFPVLEGFLLAGEINLYALSVVSGIVTPENIDVVISKIRNRSSREIEALAAGYRLTGPIRDRVRTVCILEPEPSRDPKARAEDDRTDANRTDTDKAGGSGADFGGPRHGDAAYPEKPGAGTAPAGGSGATPGAGSDDGAGSGDGPHNDEPVERIRLSRKYKIEFAVDPGFMKKCERLRTLLSTKYPDGIGFEGLFMILMDEYLERHSPEGRAARRERRLARITSRTGGEGVKVSRELDGPGCAPHVATGSETVLHKTTGPGSVPRGMTGPYPKKTVPATPVRKRSRSIPASVRDEVFLRDHGRCTYIGKDGRRCNSTWNLQIDHVIPFALGGDDSPGNLRLLCGRHNRLEAERVFGDAHMERFSSKNRS